jgi:hypothetical protein
MKKLTIIISTIAIVLFTSCTKEKVIKNNPAPVILGTFSINDKTYNIDKSVTLPTIDSITSIGANFTAFSGVNHYGVIYREHSNDEIFGNKSDIQHHIFIDDSNIYHDGYITRDTTKKPPFIESDKSNLTTIRNADNTYTVLGSMIMYKNFDSTKKVAVYVKFTTSK